MYSPILLYRIRYYIHPGWRNVQSGLIPGRGPPPCRADAFLCVVTQVFGGLDVKTRKPSPNPRCHNPTIVKAPADLCEHGSFEWRVIFLPSPIPRLLGGGGGHRWWTCQKSLLVLATWNNLWKLNISTVGGAQVRYCHAYVRARNDAVGPVGGRRTVGRWSVEML